MFFSGATLSFKGKSLKLNSADDGELIARDIAAIHKLEALELSGNTLGVEASQSISEALKKHPELKKALWSDLFTGRLNTEIPVTLKTLCDAMTSVGTRLTVLDLSDNAIGPQAIGGLEEFLSGPSCFNLKEIHFNNCGLGAAGINVAECLIKCHEQALRSKTIFDLQVFVAGRNRLEDKGARALANAFKTLGTLVEIRLYQNGIRPNGIIALAQGIANCTKLKVLDINDNTVGEDGAVAVSRVVGNFSELQSINLGDCLCRKRGSRSIVQSLASKSLPVQEIFLYGNEIDARSAEDILQMARTLPNLKVLDLHQNSFGSRFEELISKYRMRFVEWGAESDNEDSSDGEDED